jgi:4-amino-4-deoxy-L-arabinose transferase-like glycosyltransferase
MVERRAGLWDGVVEVGGTRTAQIVTALAVAVAPVSLIQGTLFQYVSFDYLWWVLIAYLVIRLLKSEYLRWWLGIGAVIGLGMMNKYTIWVSHMNQPNAISQPATWPAM